MSSSPNNTERGTRYANAPTSYVGNLPQGGRSRLSTHLLGEGFPREFPDEEEIPRGPPNTPEPLPSPPSPSPISRLVSSSEPLGPPSSSVRSHNYGHIGGPIRTNPFGAGPAGPPTTYTSISALHSSSEPLGPASMPRSVQDPIGTGRPNPGEKARMMYPKLQELAYPLCELAADVYCRRISSQITRWAYLRQRERMREFFEQKEGFWALDGTYDVVLAMQRTATMIEWRMRSFVEGFHRSGAVVWPEVVLSEQMRVQVERLYGRVVRFLFREKLNETQGRLEGLGAEEEEPEEDGTEDEGAENPFGKEWAEEEEVEEEEAEEEEADEDTAEEATGEKGAEEERSEPVFGGLLSEWIASLDSMLEVGQMICGV